MQDGLTKTAKPAIRHSEPIRALGLAKALLPESSAQYEKESLESR
jgi:hypothetical protein